ncbi:MAG: sugar ABC transporter ATP-binding protein [Phycisphaerae bacterium]|jgi:ABC-type sugar transport system ATPase subunit
MALVELRAITKRFGGVLALDSVSLSIERGTCHALIGENGAGKSTLGKILAGIHRPDSGILLLDGQPQRFASPREAARAGIGMVHQELAFCPDLSVAENLALGRWPRRGAGLLNRGEMSRRAERLLAQLGVRLDVRQPMRRLSTAQEQLVQIAAAVGADARILVLDEPTSSLSEAESRLLFELMDSLRQRGVTILYVSHRMPEVLSMAEWISVLRDGRHVATVSRRETNESELVKLMIGRPLTEYFPQHLGRPPGRELLRVDRLSSPGRFEDVSLCVRAGEIVGLAGLVGAGRSELARAIFGLDPRPRGVVVVDGRPLKPGSARRALRAGLGMVPEDRKRQGLILRMSCRENFSLVILDRLRRRLLLDRRRERAQAAEQFGRLAVKLRSLEAPAASLSGGNQQKVVLAKWLARRLNVLIVDEPTRGVDVGAKAAIHALIDGLARDGLGVLLISSELPEIINLSTRILVMRGGRLVGEIPRADATQERLLSMMAGVAGCGDVPPLQPVAAPPV